MEDVRNGVGYGGRDSGERETVDREIQGGERQMHAKYRNVVPQKKWGIQRKQRKTADTCRYTESATGRQTVGFHRKAAH